jgi:hypothetical protein
MQIKVVKTNVMWPFCIEHHINDCPNTFVTSVRTKPQKKFFTLGLPPLCIMTKMDLVATRLATKFQISCH